MAPVFADQGLQRGRRNSRRGVILAGPAASGGSEPYADNVVLLLPFDGADAATHAYDYSSRTHSLTFLGTVVDLDTAAKKFGTASLMGQLTTGRIEIPDSDDWYLPGEFTIEAWVRPNWASAAIKGILAHGSAGIGAGNWHLDYRYQTATTKRFEFSMTPTGLGGDTVALIQTSENIDQSVFHHVAVTRDASNVVRLFVDGVLKDSDTIVGGSNETSVLFIGSANDYGAGTWNGWIDDVRITKGVARYTADFTPPAEAFPATYVAPAGMILNPFDRARSLTLSNGYLTVTRDAVSDSTNRTARSTIGKNSGKWVFAFDPLVLAGSLNIVGLATANHNLNQSLYSSTEALGLALSGTGDIWDGNTTQGFGGVAVAAAATEVQLAIDFGAGRWWVRNGAGAWNQSGNPAAGTGGRVIGSNLSGDTLFPAVSMPTPGDSIAFNFGASAFANALPTGFSSWDGSQTG